MTIVFISLIGVVVAALAYAAIVAKIIAKRPVGTKKMADANKIFAAKSRPAFIDRLKSAGLLSLILFTAILYLFRWQAALTFAAAAIFFAGFEIYRQYLAETLPLKVLEAEKSGFAAAINLNFFAASAEALLGTALGIILAAGSFGLFGSDVLLSAALGVAIISLLISRRLSSYLLASQIIAALLSILILSANFSDGKIILAPAAIFIVGLFGQLVSAVSLRLGKRQNPNISLFASLIISSLVLIAAFTLGARFYHFNQINLWYLYLPAIFGLVTFIFSLFFSRRLIFLPPLAFAAAGLFANHFAGLAGIAVASAGFFSLTPFAIAKLSQRDLLANSIEIAKEAGLESKPLSTTINNFDRLTVNSTLISIFTLAPAILVFGLKFAAAGAANFNIFDLSAIVGLIFGAGFVYFLSKSKFADRYTPIAIIVLLPLILAFAAKPAFLAGFLAGFLLYDLFSDYLSKYKIFSALLAAAIIPYFASGFGFRIRLIILAAAAIIILLYLIVESFINERRKGQRSGEGI